MFLFFLVVRSALVEGSDDDGGLNRRAQTTKDSLPAIFRPHYPAYKSGQLNITELTRVCDLSRTTIYKYISLLEG